MSVEKLAYTWKVWKWKAENHGPPLNTAMTPQALMCHMLGPHVYLKYTLCMATDSTSKYNIHRAYVTVV